MTLARMERTLRVALHGCRVSFRPLKRENAKVILDQRPRLIHIDPMRGGHLECLVHELIHVAYERQLAEWGALEEPIVEVLELVMTRYINGSERRTAWWRDRLREKRILPPPA